MFLEKFSRYFRRYEIILGARKKTAPVLPIVAKHGEYSVLDAINEAINKDKAWIKQSNGEIVDLVKAEYDSANKTVVLLFHRANPDAADPTYRKKNKGKITVRVGDRDDEEEQSVSCHLLIRVTPREYVKYYAVLEEIPGLSMATIREVMAKTLNEYEYKFDKKLKKKTIEETTYCTIRAEGIKSETVADALKTGKANFITLTRTADAAYADSEGILEPVIETMKLRVKGILEEANWKVKMGALIEKAKGDGWQKFNVEIALPGNRTRQVILDREQNAKEILFVKADQVSLDNEITICSTDFHADLVKKGRAILDTLEAK